MDPENIPDLDVNPVQPDLPDEENDFFDADETVFPSEEIINPPTDTEISFESYEAAYEEQPEEDRKFNFFVFSRITIFFI